MRHMNTIFGMLIGLVVAIGITAIAGTTNFKSRLIVQDGGAPTCSTATGNGDLCVEDDTEVQGDLVVAGTSTVTGASTQTGDLTLGGGAGALTFSSGDSSIVLTDNDATALLIGSTGLLNLVTIDTANNTETVIITGTTTVEAFKVDTGTATFDEAVTVTGDLSCGGGAGALTFTAASSSVVVPDNSATALVMGSTGLLNLLTLDTGDNTETVIITGTTAVEAFKVDTGTATFDEAVSVGGLTTVSGGLTAGAVVAITGTDTLVAADCGLPIQVTAGIDGNSLTLPSAATLAGCVYQISYVGAAGGALVDISPNAADGIFGNCYTIAAGASAVVTFSGTDDADIGLTKATGLKGDHITLTSDGSTGWFVTDCGGIWANN